MRLSLGSHFAEQRKQDLVPARSFVSKETKCFLLQSFGLEKVYKCLLEVEQPAYRVVEIVVNLTVHALYGYEISAQDDHVLLLPFQAQPHLLLVDRGGGTLSFPDNKPL